MKFNSLKGQTSIAYILGFLFLMLILSLIIISLRKSFLSDANITLNQKTNNIHNLECFTKTYQNSPQNVATFYQFSVNPTDGLPDLSGNHTSGTFYGSIDYLNGNDCLFGGCLNFNGSGQYIKIEGIKDNLSSNAYNTIEFYMNWNGSENEYSFSFINGYGLYFYGNCFGFTTGNGDVYGIDSSSLVNKSVLIDAVFYNKNSSNQQTNSFENNLQLYINGVNQPLKQCFGNTNQKSVTTNATYASEYFSQQFFTGVLGPLVIYNRKLNSSEISDDYYCKLP